MVESKVNIRKRQCPKCNAMRDEYQYARTNSPFFPGKRSIFCTSCLEKMTKANDLAAVDKVMQWLDLPFHVDVWTQLYNTHKEHTMTAYFNFIDTEDGYGNLDWQDTNIRWKQALEKGALDSQIQALSAEKARKLREFWSSTYNQDQLLALDKLYNDIIATQNVSTPILKEYAKDFCELTLLIKGALRSGGSEGDVKKLMDSRDNIIKFAGFTASNAKNVSDFDSVGELFLYLYRLGWRPNWAKEKKDVVDITMHNIQQYLNRLVYNEGNIAEQVEARRESYEVSKRLEDTSLEDSLLSSFDENNIPVDYEGDDDLAYELSEYDLSVF